MEREVLFEIFALHMIERAGFHDTSVVDQNVDSAETLDSLFDGGFDLGTIEQVALDVEYFTASRIETGFRAGEFVRIARKQRNPPATFADLSRNDQTEPARTAGDKGDFASIRETGHSKRSTLNLQRSTSKEFATRRSLVRRSEVKEERSTPNADGMLAVFAVEAGDFAGGLTIDRAFFQISALVVRHFALTDA